MSQSLDDILEKLLENNILEKIVCGKQLNHKEKIYFRELLILILKNKKNLIKYIYNYLYIYGINDDYHNLNDVINSIFSKIIDVFFNSILDNSTSQIYRFQKIIQDSIFFDKRLKRDLSRITIEALIYCFDSLDENILKNIINSQISNYKFTNIDFYRYIINKMSEYIDYKKYSMMNFSTNFSL